MSHKRFLLAFVRSFSLLGVILYLSFVSPAVIESVPLIVIPDKLVHFCMYFALTLVFLYDLWRYKRMPFLSTSFLLPYLLLPIVIGGLVELAQQYFFPPRSGEWLDFLANTLGVFSAFGLVSLFLFYKREDL